MKQILHIFFFLAYLVLAVSYAFSQTGRLTLHGKVVNDSKSLGYVPFEVIKDNEIVEEGMTQKNGSYKIDLELGAVYSVAFKKEGYITKTVGVITKSEEDISGLYFFQLDIDLFKVDSERQDETMLPPVAKLYIVERDKGFIYDKQYVKWVAGQYEELE
jgi:hypothetical protein